MSTTTRARAAPDATSTPREALVDDVDEGFARLVREHRAVAHAIALRTTGHRVDAEVLVAERSEYARAHDL